METYKNILIRETRPNVIASIKAIIDYLFTNDYNTYEVIIEMADLNGQIVYKTCLAEDGDRYINVSADLPESFTVSVQFSAPTVMDNAHPNNMDYVENCNSVLQAIEVLSNYYTTEDMKLITSINIK